MYCNSNDGIIYSSYPSLSSIYTLYLSYRSTSHQQSTNEEEQQPTKVEDNTADDVGKYALKVDEDQDDKAIELRLRNFARPHMRAFHYGKYISILCVCCYTSYGVVYSYLIPYLHISLSIVSDVSDHASQNQQ